MNTNEENKSKSIDFVRNFTPEEAEKRRKRKNIMLIAIGIIVAVILIGMEIVPMYIDNAKLQVQLANMTCPACDCSTSGLVDGIESFFTTLLESNQYRWAFKFFFVLGIIYFCMILFTLAMDVIELALLVFVVIKRFIYWIISLFKKRNDVK